MRTADAARLAESGSNDILFRTTGGARIHNDFSEPEACSAGLTDYSAEAEKWGLGPGGH